MIRSYIIDEKYSVQKSQSKYSFKRYLISTLCIIFAFRKHFFSIGGEKKSLFKLLFMRYFNFLILSLLLPLISTGQSNFLQVYTSNDIVATSFATSTSEYTSMSEVNDAKVVKFKHPFAEQIDGKVLFNSNSSAFSTRILKTQAAKYTSPYKYTWRGVSYDRHFDITLIKNTSGICGTIIDIDNDKFYRIMPLDTVYSVMLEIEHQELICSLEESETELAGPTEENCEDVCPGHIDILFLIPTYISLPDPISTFDIIISDLESAFQNSNIPHTVSYNYTSTTWNDLDPNKSCKVDAYNISEDSDIINLRNNFGSDIVVFIAPSSRYDNYYACVPEIGPIGSLATSVITLNFLSKDYTFVHEMGHLFGAVHYHERFYVPVADCASSHEIHEIDRQTLMGIHQQRILHYSDPEIEYLGYITGTTNENNAGRIRATGCRVADFTPSLSVNPIILATEDNCKLDLQAIAENQEAAGYTFDWYWNKTGIFEGSNPNYYIDSGASLLIDEPEEDPCENYFIHLKVKLNGIEVANTTITQKGGICTSNVQCDPPVSSKLSNNDKVVNTYQHHYLNSSNNPEMNASSEYRLYNIYGQLLATFYDKIDYFHYSTTHLRNGIYILTEFNENKVLKSEKYFITNQNH